MKVSTKGRYGLRFLLDVATHQERGNVTLKDVARRQGISEKYLWQIVNPLKTAGLIRATAGRGGGYTLARLPTEITLHDVLAVVEGDHAPDDRDTGAVLFDSNSRATQEIWKEIDQKIADVLASFTLGDLMEKHQQMNDNESFSYVI